MDAGVFVFVTVLLLAAIAVLLIVVFSVLRRRKKRQSDLPARGMAYPGPGREQPMSHVQPEPASEATHWCEKCGQQANAGDAFCQKCGSKL